MTNVTLALPRCRCSFWLPLILPEPEAKKSLVESNNKWGLTQPELGKKPDFAELSCGLSECSFPQAWGSATLESDPTKLLPQLLDQLIALGQTAQQLRHALGGNGHRPEKISEVIQQLTEGGDHAH